MKDNNLDILTVKDVMRILNLPLRTVYNLIHLEGLPAFRLGKRLLRVRRIDLDEFIAERRVEATATFPFPDEDPNFNN